MLTPGPWQDYELLDSGNLEKLERFGPHIVRRPEPQAIWPPSLSTEDWRKKAGATFARQAGAAATAEKGIWQRQPATPERWWMEYTLPEGGGRLRFRISLSSFKHVGIFPEQAPNWDYIHSQTTRLRAVEAAPKVLNLFAYTGGASLAAAAAGAEVTHVDAIKQTVGWARENAEATGLVNIRWIVDDALAFARREARRGRVYQGIILDPPAYGRGPDGEKWLLEEGIQPLLEACAALLDPVQGFFILNLYSLGYSPLIARNLAERMLWGGLAKPPTLEYGELCVGPEGLLPLGTYCRGGW